MDSDMGVDTDTDVDVLRAAGQHVTAGGWVQWQWADRQCYVAHAMAASDCAAEGSGGSEEDGPANPVPTHPAKEM